MGNHTPQENIRLFKKLTKLSAGLQSLISAAIRTFEDVSEVLKQISSESIPQKPGSSTPMDITATELASDPLWFCKGDYSVCVDDGPRIRLNAGIRNSFGMAKIHKFWCFCHPSEQKLILCPDPSYKKYFNYVARYFPDLSAEEILRKHTTMYKPISCEKYDCVVLRFSAIHQACFQINIGQRLKIIGAGYWYEIMPLEESKKA
jgi:hypothetical protein